ncbi:hypothetical protein ACS5PN_02400 [Roseateles sp. NT4]|uniref:hypothetical protein n=1 Tax=Roseateles sp. NT4 TaxID=3453715 RepID=UPI003EEBCB79
MGAIELGAGRSGALLGEPTVTVAASTYIRLQSTADLAPLYALPIPQVFLQRAATLGYTHIRHVRLVPAAKLVQDLGEEATESILSTLAAFGLSELV